MGCRNSNLAVVTTSENGPSPVVTDAQFIMVNPGSLEKDITFLKTNGYHKSAGGGKALAAAVPSPEDNNPSKSAPQSLLRVKKGVVVSPFNHFRKPIPNVSIWKFLKAYIDKVVERHGDDIHWLRDASSKVAIKYSDIDDLTKSLASGFAGHGIQAHDLVLLLTTNTTYSYLVVLALWRLNVAVKIACPEDTQETLQRRIGESNVRHLICDEGTSKMAREAQRRNSLPIALLSIGKISSFDVVDVIDLLNDEGQNFPGDLQDFNLDVNNDQVYVPCTMGTTGISKGAVHTHKTMVAALMQGGFFRGKSSEVIMMPMRIYHVSGVLWPLASLLVGKTCLVIETISTVGIFEAMQEHHPGTLCGFPSFVVTLALKLTENANSCASITSILTSGETVSKSNVEKLKQAFPNVLHVDVSFITAEILLVTSSIPFTDTPDQVLPPTDGTENQVGWLCCYSSAKVVNPDTGQLLQEGESGELCFRTHSIMRGYVQQAEATKKVLQSGWIHTGDCGYYDTQGMIHIIGRLNEVFKCDGVYISPIELESLVMDHPDVTECAVVGIPHEQAGFVACAVVSRRFGANTNVTEIKEFVDSRVTEEKKLRGGVIFMDDLPKAKGGTKISRAEVLRMVINLNMMKTLKF